MFKVISFCLATLLISACGSIQKVETGVIEQSKLILRSEILVGTNVRIGDSFAMTISKADLTPFKMGVLGVSDSENEKLQTLTFEVNEGNQRVTVTSGNQILLNKELYFGKGQTRELRIRR
jgi:hypothetical protein|tara:strand:- start:111 stop:473 length:363 start_codon:yes stop_codon:yes gene_type:complete